MHGGVDKALRQHSIDYLSSLPFDGYAVGGSLGKDKDELIDLLAFVMPRLPQDKPNHLLGIADGESIDRAVPWGVDTFDSCYPTRVARHGYCLTRQGACAHTRAIARSHTRHGCTVTSDWCRAHNLRRGGSHSPEQVRDGRKASGGGLLLLHLPELFARIPPPPHQGPRASVSPAGNDTQPLLYEQQDGVHSPGHSRRSYLTDVCEQCVNRIRFAVVALF